MGIVRTYTDEQPKEKLLIFHGTILRSQLVMLLKNEIFFDEDSGVRTCMSQRGIFTYLTRAVGHFHLFDEGSGVRTCMSLL